MTTRRVNFYKEISILPKETNCPKSIFNYPTFEYDFGVQTGNVQLLALLSPSLSSYYNPIQNSL